VDINLLRRSWYFDYLKHAYPGLIERSREKIDVFVENLKEWERGPRAFARSPALTQRISAAFLEMIQSMVTNESRVAPVYMTNDLISSDSVNGELTRWLTQKYQLVPQGLVFNLADGQGFHDSPDVHLEVRGLADGTLRFGKGDPVNAKVLPSYANMLINRGRYLALFGQHERAIAAFKQALMLNPNLPLARQGLAESAAKARHP
jgi:tetratricopeptide (TPR) repeat protein